MSNEKEPRVIASMFDAIAHRYDRGNALLSFGLHAYWNRQLIQCAPKNALPICHLDLCCGTGEMSSRWFKINGSEGYQGYLLDFSKEMIEIAKKRFHDQSKMTFFHANAEQIPLNDASMDFITIAYGIRNICHPLVCLKEVFRVLKPGGVFGILELTRPENVFLRYGHSNYLKWVLPVVGKCLLGNQAAYEYLQTSIQKFMDSEQLKQQMQLANFTHVNIVPLTGGIATLWIAEKKK